MERPAGHEIELGSVAVRSSVPSSVTTTPSLPSAVGMTWTGPGKTYGALPVNLEVHFGRIAL